MFDKTGKMKKTYKDCVYQMSASLLLDPNATPKRNEPMAPLRYETELLAGRWCVPTANALKAEGIA